MTRALLIALFLLLAASAQGKDARTLADSIRHAYSIPGLSYAVVSADLVYELHALGVKKKGTNRMLSTEDRFRIGSNTKAITGFIAAMLVKQGVIKWNTKFFSLFPELKAG